MRFSSYNNERRIDIIHSLCRLAEDIPELQPDAISIVREVAAKEAEPVETDPNPVPTVYEMRIAIEEGKIPAIKAHRTRTGCGLKASKDVIEACARVLGITFRGDYAPYKSDALEASVYARRVNGTF